MNKTIRYFYGDYPAGWYIPRPDLGTGACSTAPNIELYKGEEIKNELFSGEARFIWKKRGNGGGGTSYNTVYLRKGEHIATVHGKWSWGMSSSDTTIMVLVDSETKEVIAVPASECFCFDEDNNSQPN